MAVIDQADPEAVAALDEASLDLAVLRAAAVTALGEPLDLPVIEVPPLLFRGRSDPPVVTKPVEWGQEPVASAADLASELGDPVWVPRQWPPTLADPRYVLLRFPGADRSHDGYFLHGLSESGAALIVSGHRRRSGANLESGLEPVAEEPFEMLSRPEGSATHLVVRTPVFDVHLSGDAVSRADAVDLAMSLREVPSAP